MKPQDPRPHRTTDRTRPRSALRVAMWSAALAMVVVIVAIAIFCHGEVRAAIAGEPVDVTFLPSGRRADGLMNGAASGEHTISLGACFPEQVVTCP